MRESHSKRRCAAAVAYVFAALSLQSIGAIAQTPPGGYAGRPLSEVLSALQAKGLRIVFTSATVTPDLRVQSEPRARELRQLLDELLAPHGLKARDGPGGIIQIVRAGPVSPRADARAPPDATGTIEGWVMHALTKAPLESVVVEIRGMPLDIRTDASGRFVVPHVHPGDRVVRVSASGFTLATRTVQVIRGATATITLGLFPAAVTHSERVIVSGSRPYRHERGVPSEMSLDRREFAERRDNLADDPVHAIQALPRVSVADDFRSEFIVRGSPFRHVEVVVDGMATHWLQHTAYGRGPTGSLTMFTSQILEDATLRAGAYPHRFGDRLGPELDVTLRDGSREQFELRGSIGGTNAVVVGEGPIGRSKERARGSWLVAARQSYLEWPIARRDSSRTAFGFSDALAKLVYDVRPGQQIGLSLLGGISTVEGEDNPGSNELGDGTNRTTAVNVFWRSTFGSSVLTQRAYLVKHRFLNKEPSGRDLDRGVEEAMVYRADLARPLPRGLLEAGGQAGRIASPTSVAGWSWQRSAYAHVAWSITPALTLSPGVRVTDSTLLSHPAITRWILGEYALHSGWTLNASAGTSYQPPELYGVNVGAFDQTGLRPERATHVDAGIARRTGKSVRWQATLFNRREADIRPEPENHPRLVDGVIVHPAADRPDDRLSGSSRGVELVVNRQSATGLAGWAAYSYARTTYTNAERGETFWADFDQRHTLNVVGTYRLSTRSSVGATFRAGSNFPIPGYLTTRDGRLVIGDRRNEVRPPPYVRLDLRGDRRFESFGRRLTIFLEVANVLDRVNVGPAHGSIRWPTGDAIGFTNTLMPRRASAGVLIEF